MEGKFCFIDDAFFAKYDKDSKLPRNKNMIAGEGGRPCYVVFNDAKEKDIHWVVPISSRVKKYSDMRQIKIAKMESRGIKNPVCLDFVFGKVLGSTRVFLIANMFPVTDKYIAGWYTNDDGSYVSVDEKSKRYIQIDANIALKAYNKKGVNLFADVATIRNGLAQELAQDRGEKPPVVTRGKTVSNPKPAQQQNAKAPHGAVQNKPAPQRKTRADHKAQIAAMRQSGNVPGVKTPNRDKTKQSPERSG